MRTHPGNSEDFPATEELMTTHQRMSLRHWASVVVQPVPIELQESVHNEYNDQNFG